MNQKGGLRKNGDRQHCQTPMALLVFSTQRSDPINASLFFTFRRLRGQFVGIKNRLAAVAFFADLRLIALPAWVLSRQLRSTRLFAHRWRQSRFYRLWLFGEWRSGAAVICRQIGEKRRTLFTTPARRGKGDAQDDTKR